MNIREILNKLDTINKPISETSWQEIYDLNKDQIKNPNLIYPDQKLKMPGGGEYVVKPGDSLSKIAKTFVPAERAKAEPAKSDVDKQIEKDKTNPQNTPAKTEPAVNQSGQPAEKPVDKPIPQPAVSGNNYDPNRAVDASEFSGFNWGKIRSKADTDYSTGDTGFKPDGGAYTRTPFQKSTTAIPQTGGTFTTTGGHNDELDAILKNLGLDKDTVVSKPTGTPTTPSTTVTKPNTPSTTVTKPNGQPTAPQSGQQPSPSKPSGTVVSRPK